MKGRFLTGVARIQQTKRKRVWKLLDNCLFKDDEGIHLVPRNFYTDNYTIPMWVAIIAGSPVDWDTRPSYAHDLACDSHSTLLVNLTEQELIELGYLRYKEDINMWVCEDIPAKYLYTKPYSKLQTNNLLYRCMVAADIPLLNRLIIRAGVAFNFMYYVDDWTGKVFKINLDRIYEEAYWNEKVWY